MIALTPNVRRFLGLDEFDAQQAVPPDEISAPVTPVDSSQWDAAQQPAAGAGGQSWAPPAEPQYDPRDADQGARESGPLPFTPISPNTPEPTYEIADGRTAPPTPNGTWEPVRTIPKPQPVDEQSSSWLPSLPSMPNVFPPSSGDQTPEQRRQEWEGRSLRIPDAQVRQGPEIPPPPTMETHPLRPVPGLEHAVAPREQSDVTDPLDILATWGESGKKLADEIRRAQRDPSQMINPWTVLDALQTIPYDVVARARQELVSDAEARRASGTDPAFFVRPIANALGLPLPSAEELNPTGRPASDVAVATGLTALAPDPFDPAAGLVLEGAGRVVGGTARAVGRVPGRLAAELNTIGTVAAPVVREAGQAAGRAGRALAEEGARQLLDMTPVPRMAQAGEGGATIGAPPRPMDARARVRQLVDQAAAAPFEDQARLISQIEQVSQEAVLNYSGSTKLPRHRQGYYYRSQPPGVDVRGHTSGASDDVDVPEGYVFAHQRPDEMVGSQREWGAGYEPFTQEVVIFRGRDAYDPGDFEGVVVEPLEEVARLPLIDLIFQRDPAYARSLINRQAGRIGRDPRELAQTIQARIRAGRTAVEPPGSSASRIWREGRETAARLNAEPGGGVTAFGTFGVTPPDPVSIPRAGRAAPSLSAGAEDAVRAESIMNAPRERMDMQDIAQRAEEVLGVKPDEVRAWQQANAAEPEYARAVRGQALRQAEYNDAESVSRALDRLEAAQIKAREAGDIANLSDVDRLELADATLEAAQARQALQTSAAASTAEGRATARALAQRRQAIVARQGVVSAERARQLGQDAAFAERAIQQAVARGTVTPQAEQRLRILVEKLRDVERTGLLAEDGVGGRLLATEQAAAQGSTRPGVRGAASRPGTPFLTTLASDIGSGLAGGVAGAVTAGATNPDDPNAINAGVAGGAVLGILGRRALGRTRPGALATFGFAPTPQNPQRAIAMGADPSRRYEFRYRVVDLNNLTASHGSTGAPNPAFPQELQPRDRGRAGSMQQVDRIARGLSPDALLYDAGRLDSGPMIVGPDLIVESGNGRTLALRRAAEQYPEQYQQYVDALRQNLGEYGLDERALQGMQRPVLVRERLSNVDRAAFAAEANNAGLLQMSAFERAAQDAGNLSDEMVSSIIVGDNDTIASALKRTDNRDLIRQWVGTLPPNEQAGVIDASGNLSAQGYERIANALLMRTYGEGAGTRLVQAFVESADPTVRNVQTALMASLPDVARAEALIRNGTRDAGLSIAEDVASAVDMLARLKREGMRVDEYLRQSAMFERELTPIQEQILSFMDRNVRRQNAIRDTLKEYALRVENSADPNQMGMFGAEVAPVGKDDAWRSAAAATERQAAENQAARRARANGAGLAGRADPADIIPATGGPEGSLAVEGQPAAVTRPGPIPENVAPVGGPEGTLAVENAPLRAANLPPVADNALPAGGPEARLMREGAPPEPARLAPVEDISTGGPEGRLQAPPTSTPAEMRALEASRIRGVVGMIDEVLANPQAPGSIERLQQLQTDLGEISKAGFTRASDIRKRLQRNGLLRAGLASKTEDVDGLVQALARVDPNRPEEMRAVLNIISKPRLIDKILEYQYVNMLSSPITQAVNVSSNVMQLAGRLLLQNPLEFAYSGGKSTGVGAAFSGAKRGFSEALPEVGQIMRTGISSKSMERAAELGDYGHINREALTEQFGKAGAALHFISTRPLQAMDALLGHMAYASAAEQLAQRKADRLLRANTPSVQGMSREQARQYVMANIWDHTDIIEKAGKISDYTLLKSNDASGTAWANRAERTLRQIGSLGRPSESAGIGEQMLAFMVNQVMPFVGVPLNFAKQGIERTAGVPINAGRAVAAARRGEGERAAELAAKATIGAGALTAGAIFALTDNLTDDGPSDAGQREIWLQTHKPNSFRIPGTASWISWEGTPFAIPFGMIAGAQRGWQEAQERATKKGMTDPADLYGSAALKAGQGAVAGFASQSFVKSLGQQYQLLTGDQTGLGAVAASAAGTASRFLPAGSMVNFLARIGDTVERDPGKPQSASEIPQNILDRMATRVPGARQTVDSRLGPYGEATPNEQQGVMGALPYYRGQGAMAGDAITKKVEEAKVGAPEIPDEIPSAGTEGLPIPLNAREKRAFKEAWGKQWRSIMEASSAQGELSPVAIERMRTAARRAGIAAAFQAMGAEERQRRIQEAVKRKAG